MLHLHKSNSIRYELHGTMNTREGTWPVNDTACGSLSLMMGYTEGAGALHNGLNSVEGKGTLIGSRATYTNC